MLRTLYARLAAVLVSLFLVIGLIYVLITTTTTERYLQEVTQHFNRDLAQRIVADRHLVAAGQLDQYALKDTFSAYMDINPSIEIYLLDFAGKILAFSADPGKVKRQKVDLAPIQAFLSGEGFPLLGDDPRSHDRRKAFSVTRVPDGDQPAGYLYVVLRGEQYDSAEQAVEAPYVLQLSAWAVTGSLGFGLLAGLLLFHLLTRRLQRLASLMDDFQQSGFTRHRDYAGGLERAKDEIDALGQTFDRMAGRIIDQWGELKQQDRLRRELVAQVSHDLRTPLAALHGYLETLQMKAGELNESVKQEYLDIALRQSGNLTQMVEGLFELAQLEARESQPVMEPCSLAELVQDVMQKFRLRAQAAEIGLVMLPPPALPLVSLDLRMTERILDNLIGNAINHTPREGEVRIELQQEDARVVVSIEDTGPGVLDEDLPRLFDPFYRSQGAVSDTRHAGLGLAIAKRMVEMQNGRIWVESPPGQGARFRFSFPLDQA
ncbi:MAG: HAMP domain-containing sensor histidine kinase [Gammaproteobacteria bacterium]|nr:HAMP domain-containing sensor histidine kinase [Gammaproteobacteria bacterium]